MNNRDFKLLVREYFQISNMPRFKYSEAIKLIALEKKILSELDRFTKEEIESLPFGSEEDILP